VEALKDTALVLLPADASRIARGLRSLKAAKLFEGYRGAPPADVDALAEACARISDAAMALGPDLAALEVNPLFVRGEKVEALDALAVWAS
jgi:succinyl-CoA synthetase beta subunit